MKPYDKHTVLYYFTEQGIEIGPLDPSHKIRRGNIFLFDFNKPDEGAQALTIIGELDRAVFSPHGLSIWSDNDRSKFLRSRDPVVSFDSWSQCSEVADFN